MANANQPSKGQGRADDSDHGKGGRPDVPVQSKGTRGTDTGSDLTGVTGQPNKPGIGQPGRGGDDLSGRGTQRSDTRGAEAGDEAGTDKDTEETETGQRDTNVGRGQQNTPGRSPGGGSNPASRLHASQTQPADTESAGTAQQSRSGQPMSTGEETLGGNQGAF